jgi:hypothetical protein
LPPLSSAAFRSSRYSFTAHWHESRKTCFLVALSFAAAAGVAAASGGGTGVATAADDEADDDDDDDDDEEEAQRKTERCPLETPPVPPPVRVAW